MFKSRIISCLAIAAMASISVVAQAQEQQPAPTPAVVQQLAAPATVQEQYRVPGNISNCVALHSEGGQQAANLAGGALAGFAGSQAGEWVGDMLGNSLGKDVAKLIGAGAGFVGGMMATDAMTERNFLCDVQVQVPGNRVLFGKMQTSKKFEGVPTEVSVVIMSDGIAHFSVMK